MHHCVKQTKQQTSEKPRPAAGTGGGLQTPRMVILGNLERNWQERVSPWSVVLAQQTQSCTKQFHRCLRAGPAWSQSLLRAGGLCRRKRSLPNLTYLGLYPRNGDCKTCRNHRTWASKWKADQRVLPQHARLLSRHTSDLAHFSETLDMKKAGFT